MQMVDSILCDERNNRGGYKAPEVVEWREPLL